MTYFVLPATEYFSPDSATFPTDVPIFEEKKPSTREKSGPLVYYGVSVF